ncbi:MAG TPA: HTH-type transcriptional activator IlvY, partial [Pseudomonadaceae bacterium]|nr:HTH-type transcriptional activator IlvY [Pseudomonadaceae bacterium]
DTALTLGRVQEEQEDLGIAALPTELPRQFCVHTIAVTPLVFIAPLDRGEFHVAEPPDWSGIPMILSESGLGRERVDRWFKEQHIKPRIYAQVAGNEAIVSMVSLGFGVGLVPKLVVDNSPLAHTIRVLEVDHDMESFNIGVCVLRRKLSNPLIKAFWDLVVGSPHRK